MLSESTWETIYEYIDKYIQKNTKLPDQETFILELTKYGLAVDLAKRAFNAVRTAINIDNRQRARYLLTEEGIREGMRAGYKKTKKKRTKKRTRKKTRKKTRKRKTKQRKRKL